MFNPLVGKLPTRIYVVDIYMFLVLHYLSSVKSTPASNLTHINSVEDGSKKFQDVVKTFSFQFVMNIYMKL